MMSPSRETRRPIERISLQIKVEGDASELALVQKNLIAAKISNKGILQSVDTPDPAKVAEKLRNLGDAIRAAEKIRKA
jgi:hypothetical protein